jgi:hypothetical protein
MGPYPSPSLADAPGHWSIFVKTARIWLPTLAATVLSAFPAHLSAQDINPPEPHWHNASTVATATVNWPRLAWDAQEVAQEAAQEAAQAAAAAQQTPVGTQPKSSEPKATPAQKKPVDDQESHQRLLGLAPMFGVVNDASQARPLSVGQKWKLFYRQTYDPFQFVTAGIAAGIGQARDEFPEYGQGMEGYAKRYGAGFADNSLGAFFGHFVLPSLLHDDPRYFRQASGPFASRLSHAVAGTVITRRDNGTSRPNYSNVFGNLIGCAIGNVYYPQSQRTVSGTVERGLQLTAYGAIGGIFQEFWPDIQKKVFKPHYKVAELK